MAFVTHFNNTKKIMWLGSVCILPNQSRVVDERFIPKPAVIKTDSALDLILGNLNATKSMAKVKELNADELGLALAEELSNGNRKTVIESIQKAMLAFKPDDSGAALAEELNAFSEHWSNQDVADIEAHLATDEIAADESRAEILRTILGDK